jgi:MFS family permease
MSDRFEAFRYGAYRRYFLSRFSTSFAVQVLSVSVGWEIYDATRNPLWLGWIGLVQFLPALLLVVITGNVADRVGRRVVMACSLLVMMVCAGMILWQHVTGHFSPLPVLGVLTLFGTARAFYGPAASSLAANLVPEPVFPGAVSWLSSSWQLASVAGPVAGGFLYAASPVLAYATSVVLFATGAGLILSLEKPAPVTGTAPRSLSGLLGGFSYIWRQKVLLGAITLDLFAVLLGGAVALLPVYARDVLDVGEAGLGLLRAAPGIGAILAIGVITAFPVRDHAGWILFVSVGLFGLATLVFGLSSLAWLSVLALICVGGFDMVSVYIREILVQLRTPDQLRGRVNAVNSIFVGASNELGEARAGFMAVSLGPVATVVAGGVAAVAVTALCGGLFPQLRRIRQLTQTHSG